MPRRYQTEYYGYRLDSVLRMNSYKLHGILNGIDMDAFNPQTDTKIFKQYGPKTPEDKLVNKTELLKLCGLEGDANTPVIGIVTRFVDQKGLDLVEAVLPDILEDDVRLVVLGTGDWKYEQMFIEAKRRWPDKVSASIMFSGDLANRIYAGADMFLMPSKFEPCGLAQMIALRYGNIPIVRETGGLKDTVHAFVDYAGTGNGFSFASYNAHDMLHVIREACGVFRFNKPRGRSSWYRAWRATSAGTARLTATSRFTTPHWAGKQQKAAPHNERGIASKAERKGVL